VLIGGSLCILYIGLQKLGHGHLVEGWHATLKAVATSPTGDNTHLVRALNDPEWPWLAILPGSAIIGFWYWCTDQYIVQRVLAGKNQQESRRGSILAAYFKLTPVFIFLIPGMVAYALTQTPHEGFAIAGATLEKQGDAAYTTLVAQILPHGIKGIVACGMIVALMASLASKFNASATLFTMDFYREWHPNASGKTEVLVGRIATAVIVFMGIFWVLVIKALHTNLYEYLQNVQGYLSPAIAVLFGVGVFWKRATAPAALWAFVVGVIGGFARLAADLMFRNVKAANGDTLKDLKAHVYQGSLTVDQYTSLIAPLKAKYGLLFSLENIHWLYWCQILFVTTLVLMVVISLLTQAPDPKTVKYTWYGATPEEKAATKASWNATDVILSLIVVACVVWFYVSFW
jgi:SSS family solute:Na+ symporter